MNILVLMSGGFHPFHPGHLALYNSAKKAFPGADVVVGATNSQEKRPFNFKDKATLATIAGVDKGHFVEVNRQFSVKGEPNIENRIQNADDTILIFVRSAKDANDPVLQPWKPNPDGSVPMTKGSKNHPPRPTSNYLLSYKDNKNQLQPMTKHAYIAFLPVQEFSGDMTSATEIRNTWPTLNDKRKQAFAMSLYPATQQNSKLLATVVNILNKNIGSVNIEEPDTSAVNQLKAKKLKEQIQRMRPLLKEASIEQKYKMLKLMKEATQLNELDLFKKKKPEPVKVEPETSPNDYHSYFSKPEPKKQKVYRNPEEYVDDTKIDPLTGKKVVDELNLFGKKPKAPVKPVEEPDDYRKFFNREPVSLYEPQDVKHFHNSRDYHEKTGVNPLLKKQPVQEFATPGGDDNGPDEDEILFRLAKQWWLGTEQDMIRAERTLASMGWEIGEDEGSYDNGGVFVVRAGDVNGKSYMSWPHEDLIVDEGQTSDMRNFFSTQQPLNPAPITPTTTGPTVATVTRQGESINEFALGGDFQPPKPPKNKGNDPWGDDDDDDDSSRPRGSNIIGKQMLKLQQQKKRIIWRPWLHDGQPDIIAIIKNVKPTEYDPNLFEFTYSWKTSGGKWVKRNTFINPGSESIYSLIPYNDYTYELRQTEESINDSDDLNEVSQEVNEISDETLQSYLGKADRQVSNRLDRMSQARERLNKNYEIYDVENPSRIIDRFEANSPELAREYYYKFIKEFNPGDQDFHFEVRRSTGIIENRIIYAGSKVNLILVYKQKPILLNKEPIAYTDENLQKYAVVAYMHLRNTTGKKFSIDSIKKAIVVKPLEVHQTNESDDYLPEK